MIQKRGDCQGECKRTNIPINSKGLCMDCQFKKTFGKSRQEVYSERRKKKIKENPDKYKSKPRKRLKTPKKRLKKKNTGELEMFREIWEERIHFCSNMNCMKYLGEELNPMFFSHRKSKGAYPELRLKKENVDLLCQECHYTYEFGSRDKIKLKDEKEE